MRLSLLGAGSLLLRTGFSVFADEAWTIDYHHALLGLPRAETTFLHQPNPNSRASLIYSLSEEGVLGALNPKDGLLVWRHALRPNSQNASTPEFLRAVQGQDLVISGTGDHVAAWSAADGRLIWDSTFSAQLSDLELLELADADADVAGTHRNIIALTSGKHPAVHCVDSTDGQTKWIYSIDSGDVPYQLSASPSRVFAILLHKTILGSLKLRVISLDPVSGKKLDEYTLATESELSSADNIITVGANSASPIIAWTDPAYSVLKINVIGTKHVASFNIDNRDVNPLESVHLHAPYHSNSLSHFLVHYQTSTSHWAEVYHIDLASGKVVKSYDLPKLAGKGAFSTSTSDANVYFTRITRDEIITVSSASHGLLGRWSLTGFGVVGGAGEIIEPVHAIAEVSVKGSSISALRSVILLTTGDWVLLREGNPVWQRPESLATTVSAAFALPAAVEALAHELEVEAHSSPIHAYIHRVTRHVRDLAKLPALLTALPQSFMNGLLGTESDGSKDSFGFRQVVVCATSTGRVIALDASDPTRILWNRKIDATQVGTTWNPRIRSTVPGIVEISQLGSIPTVELNVTTGGFASRAVEPIEELPQLDDIEFKLRDGELVAFKAANSQEALWRFVPAAGEHIVNLTPRPVNDPIASIGKVLGDRRVLYKYISPNLVFIITANDASSSVTAYVLDTVSGSTLHTSLHTEVDLKAPVTSVLSENWFVYSYTSQAITQAIKGHQLVVGELFESLVPNDRGPLSGQHNYSSLAASPEPFVLTTTYQIPEPISKLSVTQTKQGITSRQVLAVLPDSKGVVGIPYFVLDPRRPVGRDPDKDEQAEGLARYAPILDLDPKWYISHKREVLGVNDLITSPALIESTSLVFAYGLDIFGTRLSPSFSFDILGKDFNKVQMLATVAALFVATLAVAPLVTRKQVNTRWAVS